MGTQATLGAVYYHDVDAVVDYQLMVGGPGLWDINSGCGRRAYATGYCDVDAARACGSDADCADLSTRSRCSKPGPIPLAWLYEQVVNHVHATQACDVSAANDSTPPLAAFDESGFAFVAGDWDFDHPIDFQMDLWGRDGDHRWAMADAMRVFNSIASAAGHEKRWHTTPNSNHCAAIGNGRALQLLVAGMGLENDPAPPPPPPNRPPAGIGSLADLALAPAATATVDLSDKFEDEGALTFAAASSAPAVASASIGGAALRVRAGAAGVASITVTATDGAGLSAQLSFQVSVGWLASLPSAPAIAREGAVARLALTLNRPAESALALPWRVGSDASAATSDADAADVGRHSGTAIVAAGDAETSIEIPIIDDNAIEPAREYLSVRLLPPPSGAAYASEAEPALIEIQEGVCDRTPAVREALRGARPCWTPTAANLAQTAQLDLRNRGLASLRSRDLLGLSGLQVLRLQGNELSSLPAGLFEGVGRLREVDLRGNPGAPFALEMRLVRIDASEPSAAGPADIAARTPTGAPFAMRARLAIEGAALAIKAALVPAGSVVGPSLRASPMRERGARLALAHPPAVPATVCGSAQRGRYPCFQGIATRAGPPLVLFAQPPLAVASPPSIALAANGARASLPLAQLFEGLGEEAVTFEATSDAPELVSVRVESGTLVLTANAYGFGGAATVTVTAMNWAGQAASANLGVTVAFAPRPLPRSWRKLVPDAS